MIIPVIFSLSPVADNRLYSWAFFKGIDIAKRYGWPVFAQKQYEEHIAEQLQWKEAFLATAAALDYDPYEPEDADRYIHEIFPDDVIRDYIARYPSQTDAYLASQSEPWPELTAYLVERVRALEAQLGEPAEAFLCLCEIPFVSEAARQLGVTVLHYEIGPFRDPAYRKTAMLDLKGSISNGEMSERFEAFRQVASQVPVLTRREILSVFLNEENLHYASDEDPEPEFAGGLALGYNIPHVFTAENQISAPELLAKVREALGSADIQVRYHPSDPVHARLADVQESTGTLIDFIRSSRRLFTINSNVDYEAMLYGRPVYDLGNSQYGLFANRDLTGLPDHIADETFLSFIAFGYLVPFELIKSVEYLRWRLSRPGEDEIYRYHLAYYFNCLQVPESVLSMPEKKRFRAILKHRGAALREDVPLRDAPIWMQTDETSRLNIRLNRLERRYEHLEMNFKALQEERQTQDTRIHDLEGMVEWERAQREAGETARQEALKERGALDQRIRDLEGLVEWERSERKARETEMQGFVEAKADRDQRIRDLEGLVEWERSERRNRETEIKGFAEAKAERDQRIRDLEGLVEWERSEQQARETEMQGLAEAKAERDQRIRDLEGLVEWERSEQRAREAEKQGLAEAKAERDQRIRDLEGLVEWERSEQRIREAEKQGLAEAKAERDQRIRDLEGLVEWERSEQRAREAEKQALVEAKAERDQRIRDLEGLVEWERDRQAAKEEEKQALMQEKGELEQRIRDLEGLVEWERDRQSALREEQELMAAREAELQARFQELEGQYQTVINSGWYKCTGPLRSASEGVKKLFGGYSDKV